MQITAGVLEGAVDADFKDVKPCVSDIETVIAEGEEAYNFFHKGHLDNIVKGVKEIGTLLETVESATKDCKFKDVDREKLEKMVKLFHHPLSFGYNVGKNLWVNGVDILHEVNEAVDEYQHQQWKDFGYNIGLAASKTLFGQAKEKSTPLFGTNWVMESPGVETPQLFL